MARGKRKDYSQRILKILEEAERPLTIFDIRKRMKLIQLTNNQLGNHIGALKKKVEINTRYHLTGDYYWLPDRMTVDFHIPKGNAYGGFGYPLEKYAELYKKGHSIEEIMDILQVTKGSVRNRLQEANLIEKKSSKGPEPKWSKLDIIRAWTLYGELDSLSKVSKQTGISVQTLQRRFKEFK